jgi:hypothetical protein
MRVGSADKGQGIDSHRYAHNAEFALFRLDLKTHMNTELGFVLRPTSFFAY